MKNLILAMSVCSLFTPLGALGDDGSDNTYHPVTSIDASRKSALGGAVGVASAAEVAIDNGNYDQAIQMCREALSKDDDDMDLHLVYAKSLESKLGSQEERDPYLFNACVKEWLHVLRGESGDEKGLTFHGLTLPFMGQWYQDEERAISARKHLVRLTGRAPKGWETDKKYLDNVLHSADTAVAGSVVKGKGKDSK